MMAVSKLLLESAFMQFYVNYIFIELLTIRFIYRPNREG